MKIQVNFKIDQKDLEIIQKISKKNGNSQSGFIRLAIKKELANLGYLTKSELRALGIYQN